MPDFFTEIANALRDKSEKILLVGGFAVNHHGYTRNTLDLDVMIASDQIAPLRQYLMNTGFTNIQDGPVALHFQHAASGTRIDVLPVDPQTFIALCEKYADLTLYEKITHRIKFI
jgi:hypothetical protein